MPGSTWRWNRVAVRGGWAGTDRPRGQGAELEPETLVRFFAQLGVVVTRIGLEAGPLSQWLHAGLTKAGLKTVLLETRQVKAALSAMVVKTDRKDARGIAQLLRMGAGSGVALQSPTPAQEVEHCWSGARSCKASSWTSS